MEDIYRETVTAIENGANFRIDFQSRSLKVNGRHMIRNGRYDGAPWLPEYGCGDFFTDVEELYRRYKHSIPSERSQSKSRRYFMALPESDLEDGDMLYGQHRDTAQFELNSISSAGLWAGSHGIPKRWANGSGKAKKTRTW